LIWDHIKNLNNGRHWPTVTQLIEDCVAASVCQAGAYLAWGQRRYAARPAPVRAWFIPYVYGAARVFVAGVQNGPPGALGIWGAEAVNRFGVLYTDDPNVPLYKIDIARRWAAPPGPPHQHTRRAKLRPVQTVTRIQTISQLRDALSNYHMVTIASYQGFDMAPVNHNGFHVWKPSGNWAHQMALIAWMEHPFPAAYRLNSWGPDAHGTPLNGEPPGGAWSLAADLQAELQQPNVECYAYGNFRP
jgi:hypothetical protein